MTLALPRSVVHGPKLTDELAAWAAKRIDHVGDQGFGPCWACGVVRGRQLAAVVVFSSFDPAGATVQASVAAVDPRWASRPVIGAILRAGFDSLGPRMRKIWLVTPSTNARAIRFVKGIGFTQEAVLREQMAPKVHGVVFGMMRREFEREYG